MAFIFDKDLTPEEKKMYTEDPSNWTPEERAAYYKLQNGKKLTLFLFSLPLAVFFFFDFYFTILFTRTMDLDYLWIGFVFTALFFLTFFFFFRPALTRHRLTRNPKMHIE